MIQQAHQSAGWGMARIAGPLAALGMALLLAIQPLRAEALPQLFVDLNPGGSSIPDQLTVTPGGHFMYFTVNDDSEGAGLWRTDGTPGNTDRVFSGLFVQQLVVVADNRLFFRANDGTHGVELWTSDGSAQGTHMVKDIRPGEIGSFPGGLTALGNLVIFSADDGLHGREPWVSDGTVPGTFMLADIMPAASSMHSSQGFVISHFVGTQLAFFRADTLVPDGSNIREISQLWRSDGTVDGTSPVLQDPPDPFSGPLSPNLGSAAVALGGLLHFRALDENEANSFWLSTGESGSGTGPTFHMDAQGITFMVPFGVDRVIYAGRDGAQGSPNRKLWISGGQAAALLYDAWSHKEGLIVANSMSLVFLQAQDGSNGRELWRSDGTPEGTFMVRDIRPGAAGSNPMSMTEYKGHVYFRADDGEHGAELWRSDGTEAGTALVMNIRPGSNSSFPGNFTVFKDKLFFTANDGVNGLELWVLDLSEPDEHLIFMDRFEE